MRAICLNWHGDVQGDASLAYSRKCKHLLGHNNEQFEVKIIVIQFEVEQQFGEYQFSNSGILPSNAGVMLNKHPVWSVSTKSYAMLNSSVTVLPRTRNSIERCYALSTKFLSGENILISLQY